MKTHALNQYDNYVVYSSPEAFKTTFNTLLDCLKTELTELNAVIHHFQTRLFTQHPADKKVLLAVLQAYEAQKKAVMHQLTDIL